MNENIHTITLDHLIQVNENIRTITLDRLVQVNSTIRTFTLDRLVSSKGKYSYDYNRPPGTSK